MKIIGHRGARGLAPENTIISFQKALDYKVDQIEFDVRVTKNNLPVIHHNVYLLDQSGNRLRIDQHSFNDLKAHKPDLVSLQEALDFINGKIPLCIEVKPEVQVQPIIKILKAYKHRFSFGSKSQKILEQLHLAMPEVPKIVIDSWSGIRAIYRAKRVNSNLIAMNQHFLWFGFIRAIKNRGYMLYAYPLNDPGKARRWAKYGLAGVVTDFPDRFKP